jgi:HAMP domain-containing protein
MASSAEKPLASATATLEDLARQLDARQPDRTAPEA